MLRNALFTVVALLALGGAPSLSSAQAPEGEALVRTLFDGAWSRGDYTRLPTLLAPDFRFHFRGREMPMDPGGFQGMVEMWRGILPDLEFRVEDIVAAGDRVAARFTFTGTHRGEAWGIEPTGRRVTVTMMAFARIADGRIAELWEDYDEHGFRTQLTRPGGG